MATEEDERAKDELLAELDAAKKECAPPQRASPPTSTGVMSSKTPSREDVHTFLNKGIKMMRSKETRDFLADKIGCPRPGQKLIEMQRAEWDPLKIDRDLGCKYLDEVPVHFPGDDELEEKRDKFIQTAMETYLGSIEARKPATLERKKPMPREVIIEFFDACNTKMDMNDTREKLTKHLVETGQFPNQLVIEMQRDLLEVLGWEREHGCQYLSTVQAVYKNDKEVLQRFQMWFQKAQQTVMQVVREHQGAGGQLPGGAHQTPEFMKLRKEAEAEIAEMTADNKVELVNKMRDKFQVFMNLPPDGRKRYVEKLSEPDKLEFAKAQILIVDMMQKQWAAQAKAKGAGKGGGGYAAPADGKPPSQQEMM